MLNEQSLRYIQNRLTTGYGSSSPLHLLTSHLNIGCLKLDMPNLSVTNSSETSLMVEVQPDLVDPRPPPGGEW